MITRPELKQFGYLEPADFDRHPIWIGCHSIDSNMPWYHETDEETFRPSTSPVPANLSDGMLLVRARFELRDGSDYRGFVTPALNERDLGTLQPHIFVGRSQFGFWGGMLGVPAVQRAAFYAALGKSADQIFPLRFTGDSALTMGVVIGEVVGFYRSIQRGIQVEY